MGRVLVGAGGGRARGRRATWTAATWTYRARRAGFFAQRRPGVPGIASATKTRATLSTTRIYTQKLNSAILGPTGGHRPVRPQGGAARAAPTVGAPASDISRHADTPTRTTFDPDNAGRPHGALTPTHTHPPTPMLSPELGRVADRATAGRARQRAAGCREAADEAGLPVLGRRDKDLVGLGHRARTSCFLMLRRLFLWRAGLRDRQVTRARARSRGAARGRRTARGQQTPTTSRPSPAGCEGDGGSTRHRVWRAR